MASGCRCDDVSKGKNKAPLGSPSPRIGEMLSRPLYTEEGSHYGRPSGKAGHQITHVAARDRSSGSGASCRGDRSCRPRCPRCDALTRPRTRGLGSAGWTLNPVRCGSRISVWQLRPGQWLSHLASIRSLRVPSLCTSPDHAEPDEQIRSVFAEIALPWSRFRGQCAGTRLDPDCAAGAEARPFALELEW